MKMWKIVYVMMLITVANTGRSNKGIIVQNLWNYIFKQIGASLTNCGYITNQNREVLPIITNCTKQVTAHTLNQLLKTDDIRIVDGVRFVRYKESNSTLGFNNTGLDQEDEIMQMLTKFGDEYLLRVYLKSFVNNEEGRHRRRRNHMMSLMMFGIIGMGMILVPMGFKFLAVLGGKALLLAKMALILSSIQGLKKVAKSNLNYGLYHSSPAHPWHYERHGYGTLPDDEGSYITHQMQNTSNSQ
ncbi:hypothetical protein PPYR_04377 [Photinus pyralis]|uniref:Uncharacterized protein n=1 Tax=Photinus pyralis TaxID=7054 RepID=A0A5N4AXW2_PHOPY|nr:hypothetical protein PPYR_04377 [Photinus pyralis]